MANTADPARHLVADCRWSRLGHRVNALGETQAPETSWACVRDGVRRAIREEACHACPGWEPEVQGASAVISAPAAGSVAGIGRGQALRASLLIALTALTALFVGLGVTLLATPLAIAVTVACWLVAAALGGYAVFGRLPEV